MNGLGLEKRGCNGLHWVLYTGTPCLWYQTRWWSPNVGYIRLRECRHIRADRIQVKMRMQTGQFMQVLVTRLCLLYLSVLWERLLCLTGEHCPYLVSQDRDMQMPRQQHDLDVLNGIQRAWTGSCRASTDTVSVRQPESSSYGTSWQSLWAAQWWLWELWTREFPFKGQPLAATGH